MKLLKSTLTLAICSAFTLPVMAANADSAKIKMSNGGLKISQGDSSIQFGGRFMLDYDFFDGANNASNNGDMGSDSEIRRGRIFIKSKFNKDWEAKLQINVDDKSSKSDKFEDAYLKYNGFSFGSITMGKHKESFGLEELTSSKYISTIERSMMTNAFAPGRSYGVSLSGKKGDFRYTGGVFSTAQDGSNKETYSVTGRLTYTPVLSKGHVIHFGLASSVRDYGDNAYQIKERAEVHTANDKPAISAKTATVGTVSLIGLEAAGVWGQLSLQTEYQQATVNASQSGVDADYSGYYVMGSYFLTNDSRPYKKGAFGKVKPSSTSGAWELVARFSNLDAIDNNVGTKTENLTLGVNFYANSNVRFMANYIASDVSGNAVTVTDGDALSLRAQYIF
jgi:phosphate-selective porin OprO and OprP